MYTQEVIKELIQPVLASHNAEMVDINLIKGPSKYILRILVDKTNGPPDRNSRAGITLGECAAINKELGDILDKDENINESYVLEVSSPGLDRVLKTNRDFEKVTGRDINLYVKEAINGINFLKAKLDSVDEKFIILKTKDEQILKIPYDNIHKANLEIKF